MYSSGGDLHLELPTGEKEAPRNFWVSYMECYSIKYKFNKNSLQNILKNVPLFVGDSTF